MMSLNRPIGVRTGYFRFFANQNATGPGARRMPSRTTPGKLLRSVGCEGREQNAGTSHSNKTTSRTGFSSTPRGTGLRPDYERGKNRDHNIRLDPLRLRRGLVKFPENIPVVAAGGYGPKLLPQGPETRNMRNLRDLLLGEVGIENSVVSVLASGSYTDYMGNGWKAVWHYEVDTYEAVVDSHRPGKPFMPPVKDSGWIT